MCTRVHAYGGGGRGSSGRRRSASCLRLELLAVQNYTRFIIYECAAEGTSEPHMHRSLPPRPSQFAPQFLHVSRAHGMPRDRASAGRARTHASLVLSTSIHRISSVNLPSGTCLNTDGRRPRACRVEFVPKSIQPVTAEGRADNVPRVELRVEVSCGRKSETITTKLSTRAREHFPSPCMMADELRSSREVAMMPDRLAPPLCEASSLLTLFVDVSKPRFEAKMA